MDTLVNISIGLWVTLFFLQIFGYPFLIGKPKEGEYDATSYLFVIFVMSIPMILIGRILSWW